MKKILSMLLVVLMLFSLVSLAGCGNSALKFGVGTYAYTSAEANSVDGEDGKAKAVINVAAVLLDANGKIVDCAIDATEYSLGFTAKGEAVEVGEITTKYEKGDAYGMKAYGGAKKEWFEQIDALVEVAKGKTLEEVKALVAADYKGNDEVINAGCTIYISDFVKAREKAIANAKESNAKSGNTLKIGMVSTAAEGKNATAEEEGQNGADTSITVAVLDGSKVVCAYSDGLQGKIAFNSKGEDTTKHGEITTKRALGDNYGMAKYGQDLNGDGVVKEWYAQAEAFDAALVGKDAAGVAKLVTNNGYGDDALQTAGCTIAVSDMVKAAVKAVEVK